MNLLAIQTFAARWLDRLATKGGLARAAFVLGSATLATQAIGVLLSPIYSRLYTPADYGLFGVYSSIVATALTVGSLCYETGIPVGKDDSEAVGLTTIAILIVVLIGFGALAWFGLGSLFSSGDTQYQLGGYLWLIPGGIVGGGVYRAIRFWALRREAMAAIARTSVSQLIGSNAVGLGFGILHPSPLGLMLSGIVGSCAGAWGLARRTQLIPQMQAERGQGLTPGQLRALAGKYRQLPLICAPSTLFNSLGLFLPGMLLAPYYGADFAGQFFMGMKVIGLPASLIGGVLSQVFFSSAAAVARERPEDLARFVRRAFIRGAACSLLILLVGFAAPWVVPFALGANWRQSGEITLWLSIYCTVGLSVSALSYIPNVVGRLRGQFIIDVVRALAVFLLFFVGHETGFSGMAVVKGYTLVMVLNYVACYFLYKHQVKLVSRTGLTGWTEPAACP